MSATTSFIILSIALLVGMILVPSREGFQCGLGPGYGRGWRGTLKPGWGPGSCPYCRLHGTCPICSGRNPAWASKWK